MTHFVVEASVAVEYLLRTPLGLTVADMIEGASLTAPELMDAEVVSVLRRGVLSGHLEEARATGNGVRPGHSGAERSHGI